MEKERKIIWLICIVTCIGLFLVAWRIGYVGNIPFKDILFHSGSPDYIGIGSNLGSIGASMFVGFLLPGLLPLLTWLYFVKVQNKKTQSQIKAEPREKRE